MLVERVILVGLSGSGKSAIAPLVAERLGFAVIDTDDEIERRLGLTVPEIFSRFGEAVFRAVEREVVEESCSRARVVIATGGGSVLDEANWAAMRPGSVIVHLLGSTDVLVRRLHQAVDGEPSRTRPLLAGDAAGRLARLWEERREYYARADAMVHTDGMSPAEVAAAVVSATRTRGSAGLVPVTSLAVPTGRSDVYVAPGAMVLVGELATHRWPEARRAWIVSDDRVLPLWGESLAASLARVGLATSALAVPAGESSKSMNQVQLVLDWLLSGRIERRDLVLALGGGVVGDLAGFVAAIALRGVGLIQVPTSLLAMVDSSVGGKTGVNHELGKNLIGAFYQPQLVVADTAVLETLPERERRAGWAEIAKHAMIERSATDSDSTALLQLIEREPDPLAFSEEALAEVVRRNVVLKARVVALDERETGLRRLLNYGHTLGHAMEAAGYRYLHGEAVALGMRAAAMLALRLGLCDESLVERQALLLDRLGLPARFDGRLETVIDRLARDKKAVHGQLTWILPTGPGSVEVRGDVPLELVVGVARELGAS
ncbi:MAG TPA: 3-dehydroquinate synthase [Thermomicrobiaceae bacterium]|nr:3-dehydroquinate synthase [Thermomicrobiaceae bacterium]